MVSSVGHGYSVIFSRDSRMALEFVRYSSSTSMMIFHTNQLRLPPCCRDHDVRVATSTNYIRYFHLLMTTVEKVLCSSCLLSYTRYIPLFLSNRHRKIRVRRLSCTLSMDLPSKIASTFQKSTPRIPIPFKLSSRFVTQPSSFMS